MTPKPELHPRDPNDNVPRYALYEMQTTGWQIVEIEQEVCNYLTKENVQHFQQLMLDNGCSPDRIKVVRVA